MTTYPVPLEKRLADMLSKLGSRVQLLENRSAVQPTSSTSGGLPTTGGTMTGTLVLSAPIPLQVTTTSPAAGEVLVSDASGNAAWGAAGAVAAPLTLSSGQASSPILSVTNTTSAPSISALVVTSQTAGDRSIGVQVTGDTARRLMVDSNGVHSWGPGNAASDTNLYRSAAGTLKTDNNLTVGGALTLSADPTTALQAATKQYTDRMLPLAGGTMTGTAVLSAATPLQITTTTPGAGKVLTSDASGNASWGAGPPALTLINNGGALACTTTMQDIPNLSVSLLAGGTYRFYVAYNYQASGTSPTVEPGMGGTVTPSFLAYEMSMQTNNGGGGSHFTDNVLSNASRQASAVIATLSTNLVITMSGLITVGTAGTLTAQCRLGAATINVQSGGRFVLEKIA